MFVSKYFQVDGSIYMSASRKSNLKGERRKLNMDSWNKWTTEKYGQEQEFMTYE
jgi:hypothetical protein